MAQAILESGWGKSRLAATDNNLFGVKVYGAHDPSLGVTQGTWASDDGGYYAHYKSWDDSVKDHAYFLKNNNIYEKAGVFKATTPEEQITAIKKAGYATAPNYVSAIMDTINANELTKYDDGTVTTSSSSSSSDSSEDSSGPTFSGFFSDLSTAFSDTISKMYGLDSGSSSSNSSILTSSSVNAPEGSQAAKAIATAKSFLGSPYVWGGTTPPTRVGTNEWRGGGFDCSGLMQYAYKQAGVNLGRTTYQQIYNGSEVADISKAKPGDLLLFGTRTDPHHVGMYLGNNEYIHAPKTGDVVKISKVTDRSDLVSIRNVTTDGSGGPDPSFFGIGGPAGDYFARSLHGNVTSGFGYRNTSGRIPKNHTGIDIGARQGSSIKTPIGGIVTKNIPASKSQGFGNVVAVKDANNAEHYFGHMENTSNKKVGTRVKAGDSLGRVGSTGNSTGPHLHYEVRKNGVAVNPDGYLGNYGGPNNISSSALEKVVQLLQLIVTNTTKLSTIVELINNIITLTKGGKSNNTSESSKTNTRQQVLDTAKQNANTKSKLTNDSSVEEILNTLLAIAGE